MANPTTLSGYAIYDATCTKTLGSNWKFVNVKSRGYEVFLFDKEEIEMIKKCEPMLWGIQPVYIKAGYWKDDGTPVITGKLENFWS